MVKEINVDSLMAIDYIGEEIVIETVIGGTTERQFCIIRKQIEIGNDKMIVINPDNTTIYLDTIKKAYLIHGRQANDGRTNVN